ncbi:MAG: flippase-like domain-containing protein [Chroococcidiopsidaceae cyanobacterium CP_BM_RX_35]|nr:flippase-like domain-containing protein [Chroococcidiopsidaceae cyanobacterium CP_BM_RX_35]
MSNFKRTISWAGYFLVTLSLLFLTNNLVKNLHSLSSFKVNAKSILSLILATAICTTIVAVLSFAWLILIRGGGVLLGIKQAFVLVGRSQIGKYLPGNVFQYVGRVALGHQQGIPIEAIIFSTGFETFLMIVTGVVIGGGGLFFNHQSIPMTIGNQNIQTFFILFLATIVLASTLFITTNFSSVIRKWINLCLPYIHIGRITAAVILYIVIFSLFGLSLSLLLNLLWGVDTLHWYQFTWGFAIAWTIGFIMPGAPGGLGIRETVLSYLYSQELGAGLAIGLSLTLRVVTIMGDLAAFGLAYYFGRKL